MTKKPSKRAKKRTPSTSKSAERAVTVEELNLVIRGLNALTGHLEKVEARVAALEQREYDRLYPPANDKKFSKVLYTV